MDENSGSDMDDDEDGDEVIVVEDDDVDPKDRMDLFSLERVKPREGTARAVTTTNPNNSNMGRPDEVEVVDEDEVNKRCKKRRTLHERPAEMKVTNINNQTQSKGVKKVGYTQNLPGKVDTDSKMKDGVSNPKPQDIRKEAGGVRQKQGVYLWMTRGDSWR